MTIFLLLHKHIKGLCFTPEQWHFSFMRGVVTLLLIFSFFLVPEHFISYIPPHPFSSIPNGLSGSRI